MTLERGRHRAARLVIGTFNTHKGAALRAGALPWLFEHAPRVLVWALQEVPDLDDLQGALRRSNQANEWMIVPGWAIPGRGLPYFLVRRDRFKIMWADAPDISHGSRHDRRRTTAQLRDQITGRVVSLCDVHPDPLGRGFQDSNRAARKRHSKQVQAHADWIRWAPAEAVAIAIGDWNERLGERVQIVGGQVAALQRKLGHRAPLVRKALERTPLAARTATARMRRAGLVPSWSQPGRRVDAEVRLDDAFFRPDPYVALRYRRVLEPPARFHLDHPVVVCGYLVAPIGRHLPSPGRRADAGTRARLAELPL